MNFNLAKLLPNFILNLKISNKLIENLIFNLSIKFMIPDI
jgi:hypothetical protein